MATAPNHAPTGTDKTVKLAEDGVHAFTAADFGFHDTDGNKLAAVKIASLPEAGLLTLAGRAVLPGQYIGAADLAAGKLAYSPAANASGPAYASFKFQVRDDGGTAHGGANLDPTPNTLKFNVAAVNDAPVFSGLPGTVVSTPNAGTVDYPNGSAFAAIRADGSVVTWGRSGSGGDSHFVAAKLDGSVKVTQIYSNPVAFAALRADGSVVTWGGSGSGGDSHFVAAKLDGTVKVTQIYSDWGAFAALRADGSVVAWGDGLSGGDGMVHALMGDDSVAAKLDGTVKVTQIYSNYYGAFAALRADGSVVTWGDYHAGSDSSAAAAKLDGAVDVTQIYSNGHAFAALRADGSVVTWGGDIYGGDSRAVAAKLDGSVDVTQIYSNGAYDGGAFAALRADGSVVTWGGRGFGGDEAVYHYDSTTDDYVRDYSVAAKLDGSVKVTQIYSNNDAFAALRADGSVVTWGNGDWGGDSRAVAAKLDGRVDVTKIYSTDSAFAALRADGSVVTWGAYDGGSNSSAVAAQLDGSVKVKQIYPTNGFYSGTFAALRTDGSVVIWGAYDGGGDSRAVAAKLDGSVKVTQIYSNNGAFAALRADGSVVTWGDNGNGGDSSAVAAQLDGSVKVTQIYSNGYAFAALRADGSVVTWGSNVSGGDNRGVVDQLHNVVSLNNPATDDRVVYPATYIKNGPAVALDSHIQISDPELSKLNNYAGSSLTLARHGGANSLDHFSATGPLAALDEGGQLQVSGKVIGTVAHNSGGLLALDFGEGATQSLVNTALRHIAYAYGADGPAKHVSIDWTFNDGNSGAQGLGGSLGTVGRTLVNIVPLNHAPAGADKTLNTAEDTAYTLKTADFGFTDAQDHPANHLLAVKIASLPTQGTLKLDGAVVTAGAAVAKADLDAGKLVFTPAANANGWAYANFKFQVRDDGGTAGGGRDTDATPNKIAFNVSPVRDDLNLKGTAGNDTLAGDKIDAGSFDTLSGLGGNDSLNGKAGNDRLIGGAGKDTLAGGAGADTFVFTAAGDSGPGAAKRDAITDFSRAQGDKIDIHAIDANSPLAGKQAWAFVQAFDGKAGEIRFDAASHLALFDQNGDKQADFSIELTGVAALAKADFILA